MANPSATYISPSGGCMRPYDERIREHHFRAHLAENRRAQIHDSAG